MTDDDLALNFYFNRAGEPISQEEWANEFEAGDRVIARDDVRRHVFVSTVWLGLNHSIISGGPPLIFETMIFGGPYDQLQWRWPTEAAARAGHALAVKLARRRFRLPWRKP